MTPNVRHRARPAASPPPAPPAARLIAPANGHNIYQSGQAGAGGGKPPEARTGYLGRLVPDMGGLIVYKWNGPTKGYAVLGRVGGILSGIAKLTKV